VTTALPLKARLAIAAVLLAALLLGGQAAGDVLLRASRGSATQSVGRAGFAYLTGIRTYAAAVLWARLEPINDKYYETTTLAEKKYLLPSIRMVTLLDPQMEEPYYIGPWLLWEAGLKDNGEKLAREGIERNPGSGWLHAGYAQLLVVEKRMPEAAREADLAMRGKWPSYADEYEALPALEIAFDRTGQRAKGDAIRAERARLAEIARTRPELFKRPGE
jgi:hypothetical protein